MILVAKFSLSLLVGSVRKVHLRNSVVFVFRNIMTECKGNCGKEKKWRRRKPNRNTNENEVNKRKKEVEKGKNIKEEGISETKGRNSRNKERKWHRQKGKINRRTKRGIKLLEIKKEFQNGRERKEEEINETDGRKGEENSSKESFSKWDKKKGKRNKLNRQTKRRKIYSRNRF